jgi:excisionase family DNA binding protein
MTEGIEKLLTVEDVMGVLRISRPTLYRLLKARRLEPVRIGKRTLFDPGDIRAFIDGSKGETQQEAVAPKQPKKRAEAKKPRKQRDEQAKPAAPEPVMEIKEPQKEPEPEKQGRLL